MVTTSRAVNQYDLNPCKRRAMKYIRFLDVINRGFSGYNSSDALAALPKFMPSPKQANVRFMAVLLGANDSCLLGSATGQHVPLPQFRDNLHQILNHPGVKAQNPRLMLVTPTPFDEHAGGEDDVLPNVDAGTRTAEHTKLYADAAREVGQGEGAVVVDLWTAFMHEAGWKEGDPLAGSKTCRPNQTLRELMYDGLHFDSRGYKVFFREIMGTIRREWPDQACENLPSIFPAWDTIRRLE